MGSASIRPCRDEVRQGRRVDARTLAFAALAGDVPVAKDPRPSRRNRYRFLASARKDDCAVVAVVSFSRSGLIVTYGEFRRELGTWHWVGGGGRDVDWDEIPPLPEGQSPVTLMSSGGGFGLPAWRHVRLPEQSDVVSTSKEASVPVNGHRIMFD